MGYCCRLNEDNPLGNRASAGLDWWPSQRYQEERKKGLQLLVRDNWQSFCKAHAQYWLNTEHDRFVFWSFVGSWHICCRSLGTLLAVLLLRVHVTDRYTWTTLFKLCFLTDQRVFCISSTKMSSRYSPLRRAHSLDSEDICMGVFPMG